MSNMLLAHGRNGPFIQEKLVLSHNTVKTHVANGLRLAASRATGSSVLRFLRISLHVAFATAIISKQV